MKYLISGIPGTGKTSIGSFLHTEENFVHIDLEDVNVLQKFSQSPEKFIVNKLHDSKDVVITGGFKASEWAYKMVAFFIQNGFVFVWFDGDRPAAKKAFLQRNTVPAHLFDEKIKEVEVAYEKIMSFHPRIINTFDANGHFKPFAQIMNEINA